MIKNCKIFMTIMYIFSNVKINYISVEYILRIIFQNAHLNFRIAKAGFCNTEFSTQQLVQIGKHIFGHVNISL